MRHESRGPSAFPFISGPTGSGRSTTLPKAMARLRLESLVRQAALEHALAQAGPFMEPMDARAWSEGIEADFSRVGGMLLERLGNRGPVDIDEIRDEMSWLDPSPAQRLAADLAARDTERAVAAWRRPGGAGP